MKKHNRLIVFFAIVIFAILFSLSPVTALAADSPQNMSRRISDKYNRLSSSDESRINSAIRDAESEVSAIFLVAVYDIGKDIPSGKKIVSSFGFDPEIANIVLLVIKYDPSVESAGGEEQKSQKHKYEMFTYGAPHKAITNREADSILDNEDVYDNLKSGNFAAGAVAFIRESVKAIQVNEATHNDNGNSWLIIILTCVGVTIMIAIGYIAGKKHLANTENLTPAKSKKNGKSDSYHTRSYGGYRGGGGNGGFGGSAGGSRGGR